MSTRKQHPVAFIALLFPAILFANSTNVIFDAALTNATGWAYSDDIKKNNTGYFVAGHKARITSASFNFAVTSIVIHVRTTPKHIFATFMLLKNHLVSVYYQFITFVS